jgi:hypothetical protein
MSDFDINCFECQEQRKPLLVTTLSKAGNVFARSYIRIVGSNPSHGMNIRVYSQPYRPQRPVTGIALLYGDGVCFL